MAKTPVIVGNPETVRKHLTGSRVIAIERLTDELLDRDGVDADDFIDHDGRRQRAIWVYRAKAMKIYRKMINAK